MTSKSNISPDPINNYPNILNSTDPLATSIKNNFNNIYNNYLIFSNENDNTTDLTKLDISASNIQNSFNKITDIIMPCINDPTPYDNPNPRCSLPKCIWVREVEMLCLDYLPMIMMMTQNGVKEQYQFLSFFVIQNLVDAITSNKSNYSVSDDIYYLCSSSENPSGYKKREPDPKLSAAYNALIKKMNTQLTNKDTRQSDTAWINFLLYILLPIVIFIVLILLYVKHAKKSESNITTSENAPVVLNVTSSESQPKSGGKVTDTLNFITRMGLHILSPK
jgi:hypothetical protein